DFIKLQSLIPREAVLAIAEEAKKQGIAFEGHVPDAVRASEMSEAGMKSFEHLIGIFEGSSSAEDDFLKGNKTEGRFLATYDAVRAASLAALLAKNHTWQCPTLVWERGGNLLDVSDFSGDARIKYVPGPWKKKTWKRFTEEITQGYGTDDIATRKKFIEKELEVVRVAMSSVPYPWVISSVNRFHVFFFHGPGTYLIRASPLKSLTSSRFPPRSHTNVGHCQVWFFASNAASEAARTAS